MLARMETTPLVNAYAGVSHEAHLDQRRALRQ
jgi:hypothetical protein